MRIAVDAMGGDYAPVRIIKGSLQKAADLAGDQIILVGDEKQLRTAIGEAGPQPANVSIRHAPDVVGMSDHPVEALRKKPESSIAVAVKLVAEGHADAVVSAGNTGVCVAAASIMLKTLPGIKRPGIAVSLPARGRSVTLIDAGANMAVRPIHLIQYAVMASNFVSLVRGIENPRVGLLNVGEEPSKGTDLVQATHALLLEAKINYIGSVEGHDLPAGNCEVVVTDGFTGNCILKAVEGFSQALMTGVAHELKRELPADRYAKIMGPIKGMADYSEYGGAPLLGVNGVVIIAHGRSDERAIGNAVGLASRLGHAGLNEAMVRDLSSLSTNIGTQIT